MKLVPKVFSAILFSTSEEDIEDLEKDMDARIKYSKARRDTFTIAN